MRIRQLILVVLCSAGLVVTASAQRGGGGAHGAAGGRAGSTIGGGFSGGAPHTGPSSSLRFSAARPPMNGGSRSLNGAPAFRGNYPGGQGRRNGLGGSNYRRPYNGVHGRGSYANGPWAGWSGATFIGYPGGLGFDDGAGYGYSNDSTNGIGDQTPYADGDQGPYVQAPDAGQPLPYAQPPQYVAAPLEAPQVPVSPAPEPEPEDAVTLIFKNGRPAEQIHNYMLTRTTLYVHDQHRREIALADLDLAATKKANKDAGVDFQLLPETSH